MVVQVQWAMSLGKIALFIFVSMRGLTIPYFFNTWYDTFKNSYVIRKYILKVYFVVVTEQVIIVYRGSLNLVQSVIFVINLITFRACFF